MLTNSGSKVGKEMNIEEIENSLKSRIKRLAEQASEITDSYWAFHHESNMDLHPKDKARLNCWVRLRGDNLEIFWTHFVFTGWKKPGQKTGIQSRHIAKGRGVKYSRASLNRYAKDWEIDEVMRTEDKLSAIRSEYAEIKKVLFYLKRVAKARACLASTLPAFNADDHTSRTTNDTKGAIPDAIG